MKATEKNKLYLIFIIPFLFLLWGCPYNPITMPVWTAQEICDYMNENFDGDFTINDSKSEDTRREKSTTVFMTCTLFPEEIVITEQGYTNGEMAWSQHFSTNYNYLLYKNQVNKNADNFIKTKFADFNYKITCEETTDSYWIMSSPKQLKTLDEYLEDVYRIGFIVAIDARDEEVKNQIEAKVKAVLYDMQQDYSSPIVYSVYIIDDDSFDSLTSEDLCELEGKYIYLHNLF